MDHGFDKIHLKEIFNDLHKDDQYKTTFKTALDSAAKRIPLLTKVAIAVNTHIGGSLGTRSTRKQLQALMHHVAGNMVLRVNSSSAVPSTYFLPICAAVGSGKSKYYGFMKAIVTMLSKGTEILDRQIFDVKNPADVDRDEGSNKSQKKEKVFVARQLIRGPGSKEG